MAFRITATGKKKEEIRKASNDHYSIVLSIMDKDHKLSITLSLPLKLPFRSKKQQQIQETTADRNVLWQPQA